MYNILLANTQNHKKMNKAMTIIAIAFGLGILALFVYKAIFSVSRLEDEAFYITIPHRVLLGQSLLFEEWYPSQFSSFVQYPFVYLYIKIFDTTDGIVLFTRLVYGVIQLLTGFAIFTKLKKKSYVAAIIAMLTFCLYIPTTVMHLSYYTQGIICAQWVAVLLFLTDKRGFWRCFFAGILIAILVTAQPFNAFVYFAYSLAVFIYFFYSKKKQINKSLEHHLSTKQWLYITTGIFVAFCIFLIYILRNATISEIVSGIPNLFVDPEHTISFGSDNRLFRYFDIILALFNFNKLLFPVSAIILVVLFLDKKRQEHKNIWVVVCGINYIIYSVGLLLATQNEVTAVLFRIFPLFIFSIEAYLLTKNKSKGLLLWWLCGVSYTLCFGSQVLVFTGANGCAISNSAGVVMIFELLREIYEEQKSKTVLVKRKITFSLASVLASTLVVGMVFEIAFGLGALVQDNKVTERFYSCKDDGYVQVEKGPFKGTHLSTSKAKEYDAIIEDLDYINENCTGSFLVAGRIPWCYLYLDRQYATFSSWDVTFDWDAYKRYFQETSNYPDCIYVPYNDYNRSGQFEFCEEAKEYFTELFDCKIENGQYGYILTVEGLKNDF